MEKRQFTTILDTLEQYQGSEKIALICGEDELSYRELIADARHIARGLVAEGIKKGDRVLFSMHRRADAIRALFGILYAGASYVAADPEWPKERLDFAERDARTVFSMTDESCRRLREREPSSGELPEVRGEDEAAIYYTSGSTGQPKGAVLCHIAFGSTFLWTPVYAQRGTIFQCIYKLTYVVATINLFSVLSKGKTLLLSTDAEEGSADLLAASMERHRADAIAGTPSVLLRFLGTSSFAGAFAGATCVSLAGERILPSVAQRLSKCTEGLLLFDYGSSEMSHCAEYGYQNDGRIHLGKSGYGVSLHLLDDAMEEIRPGGEGELFIGGSPAKHGHYLNRPELDAEKYVEHSRFGRLFRTGDLARLEPDGEITLLGRKDGMVKLHGQRIEIGEVENAMMGFTGIRRAAVRLLGASPHEMLAGYYTATDDVSEGGLRRHLADRLPYYMVPSLFMQLDSMPENANGKLDYGALPPMELPKGEYVPPKTEREKLLCKLFAEALNQKEPVSLNDNFFALGGDSISGLKLAARLAEEGIRMEMKWLFAAPSPALLAPLLTENPHAGKLAILYKNFEEDGKKFLASGKMDSWVGSFFVPPTAVKLSFATGIYFRFTLAEDVKESRLREALGEAVRVCPYTAYGLCFNERAPRLAFRRLDDRLPLFHGCLPESFADEALEGHYGFVSFEGRELAICVSHVTTDAHGYFRFVNALFDAYFLAPSRAKGTPEPDWAADVMKYPWPVAERVESPAAKDIFRLSGTKKMSGGLQRHFFIDRHSFDVFCRQIGLSRQAAAAYLLARAIQAAHPENDKLIRVRCPIDTRTILGVPNTFQNASVLHMYLDFTPGGLLPKLTEEEARRINEDVYRQLSYEYAAHTTNMLAAAAKNANKADFYRTLLAYIQQSELCVSYIDTGAGKAMSEAVLEMAPAYAGTSGFPVMLYLWDLGEKICVQYAQAFDDPSYPDMLCGTFKESNIKVLAGEQPTSNGDTVHTGTERKGSPLVFFFVNPFPGHVNPMLPLMRSLREKGCRVRAYTGEGARERVEAAGVECVPLDYLVGKVQPADYVAYMFPVTIKLAKRADEMIGREIKELRPRCAIVDVESIWGRLLAEKHGLPVVLSSATQVMNLFTIAEDWREFFKKIEPWDAEIEKGLASLAEAGFPRRTLLSLLCPGKDTDTITYFPEFMQRQLHTFSREHIYFAGYTRYLKEGRKNKEKKRLLIYVTMETFSSRSPVFFENCIEALRGMPADVVMAIWKFFPPERFHPLPENIRVLPEVDQEEILRQADLAIIHGGTNTVSDCLLLEVPMVAYPTDADQFGNAKRIAELGAGIYILDKQPETIRRAAKAVLSNPLYRKKASALGEEMRRHKGPDGAADWLMKRLEGGK